MVGPWYYASDAVVELKLLSLHECRIELTVCLHLENVHSISIGNMRHDRDGSSTGPIIHGMVIFGRI
jgi:hypothetical protein